MSTSLAFAVPTGRERSDATFAVPRLALHHGGVLEDVQVAYSLFGDLTAPVVVALGGISAGRNVRANAHEQAAGWWQDFVGPAAAIDTQSFCVLGIDFLGGSGTTTGPRDARFPSISTFDQARILAAVLDDIGVEQAHAIVGSSYGGMVALAFGALFPDRAGQLVVISAAHEPHPMATALRSLQRRTIRLGIETGSTREAIAIARGIAMTTYRTAAEFATRFDSAPAETDGHFHFPVEDYLAHCGEAYARSFSPYGFLCLSESIDLHRVDPATISTPCTLISVDSDTLAPRWQMRALAAGLAGPTDWIEIPSLYGHDAFLKEVSAVSNALRTTLHQGVRP